MAGGARCEGDNDLSPGDFIILGLDCMRDDLLIVCGVKDLHLVDRITGRLSESIVSLPKHVVCFCRRTNESVTSADREW